MRFLADESCDFGIVRALRAAGHDVKAVAEAALGAADAVVLELAARERRVLLTEDKDFGRCDIHPLSGHGAISASQDRSRSRQLGT